MAIHTVGPDSPDEIMIFAAGPTCCAVCAPKTIDRSSVETEVGRKEPRGSVLKWKAYTGIFSDREPNPRACPHSFDRHHWFLVRDLRR